MDILSLAESLLCAFGVSARFPFVLSFSQQVSPRFECEMSQTWNFLNKSDKFLLGATLAALFCASSGDVNIPMLCLSSTSEETGVVVASSPELYTGQKLVLLDGESMGVTCALLTSTVTLGS